MSGLGQEQKNILTWWFSNYRNKKLSPEESYSKYVEEQEYTGKKKTFSNILNRLKNKGLMETPDYGQYTISKKGQSKADYILNPEKYAGKEEDDIKIRDKLAEYFYQNENEISESVGKGETYIIKLSKIDKYDPGIIDSFEEHPEKFFEAIPDALEDGLDIPIEFNWRMKADIEFYEKPIYKARSGVNTGKPVTVTGTIETASKVYQVCRSIEFQCVQCGDRILREQDEKKKKPYKCDCGSKKFETVKENYKDVIELSIGDEKEENQNIKCIYETEEISERTEQAFRPGNKLRVTGVIDLEEESERSTKGRPYIKVFAFQQKDRKKSLEEYDEELIDEVRSKVRHRTNPFEDFAESLAPEIVGVSDAKKVIAASLIGGTESKDDGRIHSLLLSNPGMGKSDLMHFIKNSFPNSHYADGKNATGVGLTATVEQDDGGMYRLRAGKLVYADEGVLSVDEFDKMSNKHAERLNTAMVKPTFPVDKAGINAELPGKATVIAAGNFEEYIDNDSIDYIRDYIPDHAESLMDRFSLVYAMTGVEDQSEVEDAILKSFGEGDDVSNDCVFDRDELVVYRELARRKDPILTQVSREFIKDWLNAQESIGSNAKGSGQGFKKDSNRYLVSLAKLTTMFARSRLADRTNEKDAENAIRLMVKCRESRGLNDGESDINELEVERSDRVLKAVREYLEDCDYRCAASEVISEVEFSEDRVEKALDHLASQGSITEVSPGTFEL